MPLAGLASGNRKRHRGYVSGNALIPSIYLVTMEVRSGSIQHRRTLMKHAWFGFVLLLGSTLTLAGCELIGDIFKAGVWVGVIAVFAVIGLIVWLFTRGRA
jgi:hypothetical protein